MAAFILSLGGTAAAAADRTGIPPWKVERGSVQCTLAPTKGPKFSLGVDDSAGLATLFVSRLSSNDFQKVSAEIRLFPSGASYAREKGVMWMPGGLAIFGLPREFVDQFSSSTQMIISVGEKKKFDIPLGSPRDAVSTLRSCHETLLRSWGVDPTLFTALSREPEPIDQWNWLTEKEFEAIATEAMARRGGGSTVMTFQIKSDGLVRDCRVVVSSGLPTLDRLACASTLKNARYEPAMDRAGRPVEVKVAYLQLWAFARP